MTTLESLNRSYEQIVNWEEQYRTSLNEYIGDAISFCKDKVKLEFKCRNYEEAEKAGIEFDEQFPVSITIEDRHGWAHPIYVTAVYKVGNLYYIDGYDTNDGKWIEGWYTDDLVSTYEQLAYFINEVLNPEEDETDGVDTDDEEKDEGSSDSMLVGYQLVDEDHSFPSQFGCWDVFRTREDAEAYREEMLDLDEYRIIEEWTTQRETLSMYRIHERIERSFSKHERIWVAEDYNNRYADVVGETTTTWGDDTILVTELNTGDETVRNLVKNAVVYQQVKDRRCPKCGSQLYKGYGMYDRGCLYCPECDSDVKE